MLLTAFSGFSTTLSVPVHPNELVSPTAQIGANQVDLQFQVDGKSFSVPTLKKDLMALN